MLKPFHHRLQSEGCRRQVIDEAKPHAGRRREGEDAAVLHHDDFCDVQDLGSGIDDQMDRAVDQGRFIGRDIEDLEQGIYASDARFEGDETGQVGYLQIPCGDHVMGPVDRQPGEFVAAGIVGNDPRKGLFRGLQAAAIQQHDLVSGHRLACRAVHDREPDAPRSLGLRGPHRTE